MNDIRFSVSILDGHWSNPNDEFASRLTYGGLVWDDALTLVRWSLAAGYEVIIRELPPSTEA